MKVFGLFRIFKFWFKLLQSQNCILYTCYNVLREECDQSKKSLNSWAANFKNKLCEIGPGDFWFNQDNIRVDLHLYIFMSLRKALRIFIYIQVILNR